MKCSRQFIYFIEYFTRNSDKCIQLERHINNRILNIENSLELRLYHIIYVFIEDHFFPRKKKIRRVYSWKEDDFVSNFIILCETMNVIVDRKPSKLLYSKKWVLFSLELYAYGLCPMFAKHKERRARQTITKYETFWM